MGRGVVRRELKLAGYAFGNFGKNLVWSGADVSLLFLLTDLLGMHPATAGLLLFGAMGVDIAGDVLVGALAARAGASASVYRRMLLIGSPACAFTFAILYALPELGARDTFMIAAAVFAFRASYSLIDVPHNILLGHVSMESRERGRAAGYRFFFSSSATLCVAWALPPIIDGGGHNDVPLFHLAIFGGTLFWWGIMLAWRSTAGANPPVDVTPDRRAWRSIFAKPLVRQFQGLAVIAFLTGFALPMFSRMLIYRGVYLEKETGYASTALALLTVGQIFGVALWTWLLRYQEKAALLAWSHLLAAGGFTLAFLINGEIGAIAILPIIGIGLAGVFMMPWAILVDVVDLDQWRHGSRREAAMFIMFLVLLKGGAAVSPVAIGVALDSAGFVAGSWQPNTVKAMMEALAYGAPITAALICAAIASRMPLTHRLHAQLLRLLER